jgi:hypothetical protein
MGTATIVVLVILNLPLYAVMAWVIFGSWSRFLEDLKTTVGRSSLANLKWLYFLVCAFTLTYLEYRLLVYCFPACTFRDFLTVQTP